MSVRINVDFPTFLGPQTKMTAQPSISPKNETYSFSFHACLRDLRSRPESRCCIAQPPLVYWCKLLPLQALTSMLRASR